MPNAWGFSLSSPQIDTLTNFLGTISWTGDPGASVASTLNSVNPLLRVPVEYGINTRFEGSDLPIRNDDDPWGTDYLLSQTGAPGRIIRAFGIGGTYKDSWEKEQADGEVFRQLINYLSGAKFTNYTNPTSEQIAHLENLKTDKEKLLQLGYTADEVEDIRRWWTAWAKKASDPEYSFGSQLTD